MFCRIWKLSTIILLTTLSISALSYSKNIKPVTVTQIRLETMKPQYEAFGSFNAVTKKDYLARNNGYVDHIYAKDYGSVKKGQELVTINKDLAKARLDKRHKIYNTQNKYYENYKKLFERNVISKTTLDNEYIKLLEMKVHFKLAENEYRSKIKIADFDGIISRVKVNVNQEVRPGDFLCSLINPDDGYYVIIDMPSKFLNTVSKNNNVKFIDLKTDDIKEYDGIIEDVSSIIDRRTSTFEVKAQISKEHQSNVADGYPIKSIIYLNQYQEQVVPIKSIIYESVKTYIFVIDKMHNVAQKVEVEIGHIVGENREVRSSNIRAGQYVVTEGASNLQDSDIVKIVKD